MQERGTTAGVCAHAVAQPALALGRGDGVGRREVGVGRRAEGKAGVLGGEEGRLLAVLGVAGGALLGAGLGRLREHELAVLAVHPDHLELQLVADLVGVGRAARALEVRGGHEALHVEREVDDDAAVVAQTQCAVQRSGSGLMLQSGQMCKMHPSAPRQRCVGCLNLSLGGNHSR